MKVKVYVDKENVNKTLSAKSIKDIADKLGLNINEYIIIRNGELVTVESEIKDKDVIKFLSVVSGG